MFVWQDQFQFSIIMAVKQKHLSIIKLILVWSTIKYFSCNEYQSKGNSWSKFCCLTLRVTSAKYWWKRWKDLLNWSIRSCRFSLWAFAVWVLNKTGEAETNVTCNSVSVDKCIQLTKLIYLIIISIFLEKNYFKPPGYLLSFCLERFLLKTPKNILL